MKRYPGLDLLRALAICWVMLFHSLTEGLRTPPSAVCTSGWMAVDLFFVLSGYLIGTQLFAAFARGDPTPIRTFYVRRMLRILPTYFAIVSVYTWLPWAREQRGFAPAWQFLTFTENYLIDYHHDQALSHAWSLCVEEHFYWSLPILVMVLLPLRSWKRVVAICGAVFFAGLAYRWLAWSAVLHNGAVLRTEPYRFVEVIYYPTIARMDGLLAGVCLALVKCFRPRLWQSAMKHPYALLASAAAVLAGAMHVAAPRTTFAASVFGFPLLALGFALLVAAAASEQGWLGKFRIPGAQFVATITFSLYLSHKMTWHLVRTYAPALVPPGTAQSFLVYAVAAMAVGTLLYFTIERTFLRLRDRPGRRQAANAAPIAAEAMSP